MLPGGEFKSEGRKVAGWAEWEKNLIVITRMMTMMTTMTMMMMVIKSEGRKVTVGLGGDHGQDDYTGGGLERCW